MVNKQSLWFVTLFSLIIVLCIYYFSTDQTSLSVLDNLSSKSYVAAKSTLEDDSLSVLKITDDESTMGKINELQNILLDNEATLEEKNNAYDELEVINYTKSKEEEISRLIKKEFDLNNFVKINEDQVSIVISSNVHNSESANKILRKVQEKFNENKYITIKYNG